MQIIDTEAISKAQSTDLAKPPMKTVPDEHFPRILYRYPKEHYRTVIEKPSNGQAVERLIPNAAKALKVHDEKELAKALKVGWKKEAFVPKPLEDDSDYEVQYEGEVA